MPPAILTPARPSFSLGAAHGHHLSRTALSRLPAELLHRRHLHLFPLLADVLTAPAAPHAAAIALASLHVPTLDARTRRATAPALDRYHRLLTTTPPSARAASEPLRRAAEPLHAALFHPRLFARLALAAATVKLRHQETVTAHHARGLLRTPIADPGTLPARLLATLMARIRIACDTVAWQSDAATARENLHHDHPADAVFITPAVVAPSPQAFAALRLHRALRRHRPADLARLAPVPAAWFRTRGYIPLIRAIAGPRPDRRLRYLIDTLVPAPRPLQIVDLARLAADRLLQRVDVPTALRHH